MPRSDDAYDLVHTYDQAKAGKSKTARPAVRELGRDGAPVRLFIQEERDPALVNTPPSGVRYVFVDQDGDLRRKNPDGSDELAVPTTPNDASYLTVNSETDLSDERQVTTSSRVSVTDNGPDSTAEIDVVEDQIEAGNLAGSTGSAGQVLVTDGSNASFGAGAQNVPDWQEDPNSPLQFSGSQAGSVTLSQTYDQVLLKGTVRLTTPTGDFVGLTINGLTSGYGIRDGNGNRTTGLSTGRLLTDEGNSGQEIRGEILLMGDADLLPAARNNMTSLTLKGMSERIDNTNASTPVSSVGMRAESDTLDVGMRVYGWEF